MAISCTWRRGKQTRSNSKEGLLPLRHCPCLGFNDRLPIRPQEQKLYHKHMGTWGPWGQLFTSSEETQASVCQRVTHWKHSINNCWATKLLSFPSWSLRWRGLQSLQRASRCGVSSEQYRSPECYHIHFTGIQLDFMNVCPPILWVLSVSSFPITSTWTQVSMHSRETEYYPRYRVPLKQQEHQKGSGGNSPLSLLVVVYFFKFLSIQIELSREG